MRKKLLIIAAAASAVLLAGCQKTTGLIGITYYPDIELEGDNPLVVQLGASYVEPGFTVTLNGEDITSNATVSSTVDTSAPGIYSVTYSAVNADGFSGSATRNVYVLNPGGIDNVYMSATVYGTRSYNVPFIIKKASDGVYEVEDLFGGFYCYGRYPGYEPTYDFHCESTISINSDNTLKLLSHGPWYFGSSFDYDSFEGTYDPATGVLAWTIEGDFSVKLTPFNE